MDNLKESKTILAKLMATEDITVRHLPVSTASFDVKNRVLTCPIWKDTNSDLYDLLMGHEVGHALWTTPEGWHDTLTNRGKGYKGYLNCIEDARIEKKIKNLYPGIRRSFINGYRQLFDRDFFGVKELNVEDYKRLPLIDRLNLYAKGGVGMFMPFEDKEKIFVKRLEEVETWEDVVKLADDLYEFSKKNEKDKFQDLQTLRNFIEFGNDDSENFDPSDDYFSEYLEEFEDDSDDSGESNESDSDKSIEKSDGNKNKDKTDGLKSGNDSSKSSENKEKEETIGNASSDKTENEKKSEGNVDGNKHTRIGGANKNNSSGYDTQNIEPQSLTDTSFREKEDTLLDSKALPIVPLYLPEVNLDNIIVPNKKVLDSFEEYIIADMYVKVRINYNDVVGALYTEFMKHNGKYIALLVKEFEMRKNAKQYSRQRQSKTGELDSRALYKYRFTSDIFRKITTTDKGKSHGMMLYLDMSSSMMSYMGDTIEQLLVLITFCKKVGIPFDVYGFCDADTTYSIRPFQIGKNKANEQFITNDSSTLSIVDSRFHLKRLISSDLSARDIKRATNMLVTMAYVVYKMNQCVRTPEVNKLVNSYSVHPNPLNLELCGTPFIETLIASKKMIMDFKSRLHSDIVNVVYLTDGAGNNSAQVPYEFFNKKCRFVAVDRQTKYNVELSSTGNWQAAITQLMKKVTGCHHIGFFVGTKYVIFVAICDNLYYDRKLIYGTDEYRIKERELRSSLVENGFVRLNSIGYDSYYYVLTGDGLTEDSELKVDVGISNKKLAKLFIKNQNAKTSKRAIGAMFAKEIATQFKELV